MSGDFVVEHLLKCKTDIYMLFYNCPVVDITRIGGTREHKHGIQVL